MRILVAEDDVALASFVKKGMESERYAVDVSTDGEQARAMAGEMDFDRVVLHLNLPRLDNVTILRFLRTRKPSLPILVLTGRTRVEDRVLCLDLGADDRKNGSQRLWGKLLDLSTQPSTLRWSRVGVPAFFAVPSLVRSSRVYRGRVLGICCTRRGRFRIQHGADRRQEYVRTIGLGHERIYPAQRANRQFQPRCEHDDRHLRFDLLDLSRNRPAVQQSKVIVDHNRIHRTRHEQAQTITTVGRGKQVVSALLQLSELAGILVYAQQRVVGSHNHPCIRALFPRDLFNSAHVGNRCPGYGSYPNP
jgi:CheY-like chemotaxis protein